MRHVLLLVVAFVAAAAAVLLPTQTASAATAGNGVQVANADNIVVCAAFADKGTVETMLFLAEYGGFAVRAEFMGNLTPEGFEGEARRTPCPE